jgi:RNA polymerase sigma-70 factor (ECF subfamily)
MSKMNDPRLPERIRVGEPGAIPEVVEAYLEQILRAASGAGLDAQHAEDVTQATFATFIEKASQFEGRSHVRTWLFGILYRKVSEARRGLERDRRSDDIEDVVERRFKPNGMWSKPPQPVRLYGAEVKVFVDDCLGFLPTAQRMAFLLREVEDMTTEEICKILEVTTTNLGVLLYRGRNWLRECLESKGVKGSYGAEL